MAKITVRRFLELLLPELLLSVIFSALFITGWIPSVKWLVTLVCALLLGAYFALQFRILRRTYIFIRNNRVYVLLNLLATACFFAVNILCCELMGNTLYTWFFGLFKLVHYFNRVGIGFSTVLVQLFAVMLVFLAPFGVDTMNWEEMNRDTCAVRIWQDIKYKHILEKLCLMLVLVSLLAGCGSTTKGDTQPDISKTDNTVATAPAVENTGSAETRPPESPPYLSDETQSVTDALTPTEGQTVPAPRPTDPEPTEEQTTPTETEPEQTETVSPEVPPETTEGGLVDGGSGDFTGGGEIEWN